MNHSNIDQRELDRLVDGECDEAARRSVLERVAATNAWKQLALTFLEAQALRQELRDFCSQPTPNRQTSVIEPTGASEREFRSLETVDDRDTRRRTAATRGDESPNRAAQTVRRWRVTSVTAAALLLVTLGNWWLVAQRPGGKPIDWTFRPPPVGIKPSDQEPDVVAEDVAPLPTAVQFVVNDGQSDVPRVINVPIQSSAQTLDVSQWQPQSVLSAEARQWLADSGHEVDEDASLLPVTLPNGRSVAFPVHQVRVNYRGPQWHQ